MSLTLLYTATFFFLLPLAIASPPLNQTIVYWKTTIPQTRIPEMLLSLVKRSESSSNNVPTDADLWHVSNAGLSYGYTPLVYHNPPSDDGKYFLEPKTLLLGNILLPSVKIPSTLLLPPDTFPLLKEKNVNGMIQYLSIPRGSEGARVISDTIQKCEAPPIEGVSKSCVATLEDMIEFLTPLIGRNSLTTLQTSAETYTNQPTKSYRLSLLRQLRGEQVVSCHLQNFPYWIYMCHHSVAPTKVYVTEVVGLKGQIIFVCHTNTSAWDPRHKAFNFLGLKPGPPICHSLPQGDILWVGASPQEKLWVGA